MIYKCDICKYNTEFKSNLNRHLQSIEHKNKIKGSNKKYNNIEIEEDISTVICFFICEECNSAFKHKSSLSRHKLKCTNIIMKQQKDDIITYNDKINELQDNGKFLKGVVKTQGKLLNNAGKLLGNNMSIINFLVKNVSSAPALEYFKRDRIEEIIYNGTVIKENIRKYPHEKENHFPEHVIYTYNHNVLLDYLCSIIVEEYKKKDPKKQAMWISDVPRTVFTVNKKRDKKKNKNINQNSINISSDSESEISSDSDSELEIDTEWTYDKKGLYVKEIVIDPLMDYVLEKMRLYVENINKWLIENADKDNSHEKTKKQDKLSIALEIISELKSKSLHTKLVKAIAPMFYMTPELRKTLE